MNNWIAHSKVSRGEKKIGQDHVKLQVQVMMNFLTLGARLRTIPVSITTGHLLKWLAVYCLVFLLVESVDYIPQSS